MKEASIQRDDNGYRGQWDEVELSEDNWKQELTKETGSDIRTVEEGYGETLSVYFENGRKAIVDNS